MVASIPMLKCPLPPALINSSSAFHFHALRKEQTQTLVIVFAQFRCHLCVLKAMHTHVAVKWLNLASELNGWLLTSKKLKKKRMNYKLNYFMSAIIVGNTANIN